MSLVGTWVLATDGRYYEEPTLYDDQHWPPNWFLYFDDDDPPELVVRQGTPIPDLPYFKITFKGQHCASAVGPADSVRSLIPLPG